MYTLLLVECDSILREVLREVLELEGYRVIEASNGLEAMSLMRQQLPHLVLSAVRIPPLTGTELLSLVKDDGYLNHIPFIFVTGSEDLGKMLIDMHLQYEATDVVKKPFRVVDLLSAIKYNLSLYYLADDIPDYDHGLRACSR